ncbi:helicase-related protein [Bradyrhizobium elkanii]|uniref:helicase-related protein n=2 Tax=Bradyrhizobium elkanii TaxID=29448 RepID=UPI0020A0857A|nr:helicase-related protein [Bradyrhizobium elkanii]MCP1967359.1 hypothetical protein [Bradyrhizobium elkanii]MCS3523532.1 hypothetical protein [Bradyrhizobium elkanii]MCS4071188.1 hypothetical protein [Bradyrhizobium elkanii]MCS4077819.1 hypothetical protein [Bradyrhizobium elkanii]MCS4111136.1 hypothetical protein [Bradyrhizobium elkanii]
MSTRSGRTSVVFASGLGNALLHGIGVHHGGVPRALQQYFIRQFNDRKVPYLVCTSTIIEGVNTVAKNVVVYDRRKSKSVLEHFTYKNIEGRAGRMNHYFVGKVYVLEAPPTDKSFSVEFPVGVQRETTPLSLLLSLPDDDLRPISKERVADLFSKSFLSPLTLRANRHVSRDAQEAVANEVLSNIARWRVLLSWTGIPSGAELGAVCDLIFRHLNTAAFRENDVFSGDQLAWHINELRVGNSISKYIRSCVNGRRLPATPSDAVESALRVVRNIVCQRFPRDLMVIDAIQRDILGARGFPVGNYALFAEQAENLFMPATLFALDEYGIPIQTAEALRNVLMPADALDDVLKRLGSLNIQQLQLSGFEREIMRDVIGNLFPRIGLPS